MGSQGIAIDPIWVVAQSDREILPYKVIKVSFPQYTLQGIFKVLDALFLALAAGSF
jgi:hypothetical protein